MWKGHKDVPATVRLLKGRLCSLCLEKLEQVAGCAFEARAKTRFVTFLYRVYNTLVSVSDGKREGFRQGKPVHERGEQTA